MSGPSQSRSCSHHSHHHGERGENGGHSGSHGSRHHRSDNHSNGSSSRVHYHSKYHYKSERIVSSSGGGGCSSSNQIDLSESESEGEQRPVKRREGVSDHRSHSGKVRRDSLPLYRHHQRDAKKSSGHTHVEADREEGERSRETSPGTPTNDSVPERKVEQLDHSLLLRKLQHERNLKTSLDRGTASTSPSPSPQHNALNLLATSSRSRSPSGTNQPSSSRLSSSRSPMEQQPQQNLSRSPSDTAKHLSRSRSLSQKEKDSARSRSSSLSPLPKERSSPSPPPKSLTSSRSPKPSPPPSRSPSPFSPTTHNASPLSGGSRHTRSRSVSRSPKLPSASPSQPSSSFSPLPSSRRSTSRSPPRLSPLSTSGSPLPQSSPSVSSPIPQKSPASPHRDSVLDLTPPSSVRKRQRVDSSSQREMVMDESSLPEGSESIRDSPPPEHSPLLADSPQVSRSGKSPREPPTPQPAIQLSDSEDEDTAVKAKLQMSDSDSEARKLLGKPVEESDEENDQITYHLPALMGCRSVNCYRRKNKIDEGQYGVVFRAEDKITGEIVALKKIKMGDQQGGLGGFPVTSLREINILRALDHPNIVTIKEIVTGDKAENIFMVMEYMEHDLKMLMRSLSTPFSQAEVKCLVKQLLEATACMHENWILHRDLKTSNLLLNNRGVLKVCDFGLARYYGSPLGRYTQLVVTLWYRAPEILLGCTSYSSAVDMWSVGCIFAEFLLKEPLLPCKSELFLLTKMFKLLGTPTPKQWPGMQDLPLFKTFTLPKGCRSRLREKFPRASYHGGVYLSDLGFDLLEKMLAYDPTKRISAAEALKHPYFEEFPKAYDASMMRSFPSLNEDGASRANRHKLKSGIDPHVIRDEMEKMQAQNGFFLRDS